MSDLATTQRALAELLLSDDPEASALADRIAAGSTRLTPSMQLDIYREQFLLRHLDVLRDDFQSIAQLVGADAFETLGKAYLKAFPPRTFTLRDLGSDLARFLAEALPWKGDPLLAELARVEWAFVEAFDAPDGPRLNLATVASMPEDAWSSARIVLGPSVQRLALAHPSHDYRLAVRMGEESVARPALAPSWAIVFRGPDALQCLDVEHDAFALLDELARGVPLGEACERVAAASSAAESAFEANVAAWFRQWTALGLIREVATG